MQAPYCHIRPILWGDTDAALIVYTVRFFDYAMEAIEGWFVSTLDLNWFGLNVDRHIGTPFVNVNVDIGAPLTPRHQLTCLVYVERLGNASLVFRVLGERDDGVRSFDARFTCCFVDNRDMTSLPIPSDFRARIEDFIAQGGAIAPKHSGKEEAGS